MSGGEFAGSMAALLFFVAIATAIVQTDRIDRARVTECELRFELAATSTDSLTVMREYPFCEVGP